MPKYAANLSVAPLQPQKPFISTSTINTENQSNENSSSKEPSTWTDPFTSDGQECKYEVAYQSEYMIFEREFHILNQ